MRAVILDAGAFIAAERGSSTVKHWLAAAARTNATILVPALVIAEIWRQPPRPHAASVVRNVDTVVALDVAAAKRVGALLGNAKSTQIVDTSVALVAIANQPSFVLTSDADDIATLVGAAGVGCRIGLRAHAPVQIIEV
jgi:predicted nucleic acid-binding protein